MCVLQQFSRLVRSHRSCSSRGTPRRPALCSFWTASIEHWWWSWTTMRCAEATVSSILLAYRYVDSRCVNFVAQYARRMNVKSSDGYYWASLACRASHCSLVPLPRSQRLHCQTSSCGCCKCDRNRFRRILSTQRSCSRGYLTWCLATALLHTCPQSVLAIRNCMNSLDSGNSLSGHVSTPSSNVAH